MEQIEQYIQNDPISIRSLSCAMAMVASYASFENCHVGGMNFLLPTLESCDMHSDSVCEMLTWIELLHVIC